MRLELRPIGTRQASVVVKRLHRHLPRVVGGLFASSVFVDGELVGVGVASQPKAPRSRDGFTVEITRVATDGHRNACSKLYGALWRGTNDKAPIGAGMAVFSARIFLDEVADQVAAIEVTAICLEHSPQGEGFAIVCSPSNLTVLRGCESPAETRLAVHLLVSVPSVAGQVPVVASGRSYRLDFAVERAGQKIAIEVDGHDYHERTKEQAAHDKSRDRALQAEGWRVLRFTGSEVWAAPRQCAEEVWRLIERGLAP